MSWKLVLFVGIFLVLYIPFILPFFKFPDTEYATVATAFGRTQIEFLAMAAVILAALAMIRYVDRLPLTTLGLTLKNSLRNMFSGTAIGAALLLACIAVLAMLGMVTSGEGIGPLDDEFFWSCTSLFFNVVTQEVMVHGYAQQIVRANFGSSAAVFVSSCLFVLMHWTLFNLESVLLLTNLLVVGAMLGIAFLWSRSLWLPIGIHFGWNMIQGPLLGLAVTSVDVWPADVIRLDGPELLTGGSMGLEGGIVTSIFVLGAAVLYYRRWQTVHAQNASLEYTFP